jgi:hypothetical protein
MRSEPINKTLLYTLDPEVTYTYNIHHGTEYPYNGFPPGIQGKRYKKTRFIEWEPIPEDIIIRHHGSQVFMNFTAVFPNNQDVMDPNIQIFQLRSKKVDIQNYICEQINFFCALYDDDNELITNMLIAKYITDSGEYNIRTFDDIIRCFSEHSSRIESLTRFGRWLKRMTLAMTLSDSSLKIV